jgi:flagellar hook assembly protein FlgD
MVYDLQGKVVKTLVDASQHAGDHTVTFDAHNLPSGIYFYRIRTDTGWKKTGKMVLLR